MEVKKQTPFLFFFCVGWLAGWLAAA